MKKILCILSILALLCSALGIVSLASTTGQLTVTSGSGNPGEPVLVDIAIADNPGLVTLSITVAFDPSVLELTGVTDTQLLGGNPPLNTTYTSPYTIAWVDYTTKTDNTQNGVIAQLAFRIKDTAESGTSEVVVSFNNSYKVDGVTKNQLAGGSGLITIGSADPGKTNLLQNISTAYKEDFDTFMINNPDSMIWDDTYVYGHSTSPWFSSNYFPQTLFNNDKATKAYADEYGYAYVYDGDGGADGAAARRVGYWFDLGDTYRLSDVNLYVNTLNYCVYDFSVYGTASFTANSAGTASARAAEVDAMICENNLLGHFKTTAQGLSSALSLTSAKTVRYVLIVFNKLGSDPGNSNAANAGAYGENHLPGASSLNHGGICVTEIEIFGTKPENLLQNVSTTYKEDFDTFMIENPDSMIWDDTYVYGNSTAPWFSSNYFPQTLFDNDKATKAYANDYGYAYVYDGDGGADGAAARRVGYWFDLGDTYRLSDVNLYVNTLNYCVYDFSVYGTATFTANSAGTASARAAEVDAMICESNLLGHFKTTAQGLTSALSLADSKAVRYVLIVFNKLGSDPGNSNAANAGVYGENHLPGASSLNNGGICVTEIEIFGTKPENLLQNVSTTYKEDFDTFMIENPDSMIWDDTYVYGNSTSPWFSSNYFPQTLFDNDKATKAYADEYGYAYVYDGDGGAAGAAARRVGYWFDLGDTYRLSDVNLYVNTLNYCVYDFSVYGTATFTANSAGTASARAAEVDAMICESNLLGHFKTTAQGLTSALSLADSKAVRYVLIVFNKLGSDPGNSNAANAGAYGENHLPGASSLNHGGICVTEIEIFGTKVSAAPLKPPTTLGATINKNATDDIRFISALPSDLPHDRYTLTEYGMLVMPNQYLPGGVNEKEGAALVYGNAYAATASYAVSEDTALTPAMQFTADLVGSSQGVYPSVKFAVRSYVIYEDETGAQTIVYGDTLVRSVWHVARTIACTLLTAKEAGTINATLTYTDAVTAEFTAAEAESVTSKTDVTFADLYEFICLNHSAVALLVDQS